MDPETALVTIGVPVYNGERFLPQCLDSLLSQTYRAFVLLISDNASTDRTQQICHGYVKSDPRVRYHRNPLNIGLYGNFNQVLRLIRTPYIKLASADDFWAPTMLADAIQQMQSDASLVLCYPRAVLVNEDGEEIGRYDKSPNLMEVDPTLRFRRVLNESGLINQLMGVMRTAAVHSMLPLMKQPAADWVFLAELSLYGKIMELPKFQYFRRFHEGSSSWDRESQSHQVRLVSSEGTRRVHLRAWKHHCGLMRRVVHSPLSFKAKMELLHFLGRRAVWDRAALIDECRQLLWPARATASSPKRSGQPAQTK
jgi:glycosyltransferase involved in cell wall biosynthesis